jgi:hypothetical protein
MNENTIQDLINLKEQLLQKVASIDQILEFSKMGIAGFGGSSQPIAEHIRLFKQSDSYKEKIAKVLKSENRFLNVTQLINIIADASPKIAREDVKDAVNSAKSALLKEESIVKITIGTSNQNSFYGSPNWLEAPNKPKAENMYDETLIKEKRKIEI